MQCADKTTIIFPLETLIPSLIAFPGVKFFILITFLVNCSAFFTVKSVE